VVRQKLGIELGDKLLVYVEGDKITITRKKGNVTSLNLTLGKKITDEKINEIVNEAGKEINSNS